MTEMSFVAAPLVDAVDVDVRGGLRERIERIERVVLGAEQALLFGRDHQEQERALRLRLRLLQRLRDLEHGRDAGRVVERAVVDRVAVDRRADAQVIPVRRVDDVLVLQHRVAAFELRDDVARVDRAQLVGDRHRRLDAERHRLELARQRLLLQRVEILARHREELLRRVERDPALDVHLAHVLVGRHEVELLAQVALDDGERDSRPAPSRGRSAPRPRPCARPARTCRSSGRSRSSPCRRTSSRSSCDGFAGSGTGGSLTRTTIVLPLTSTSLKSFQLNSGASTP